MCGISGIVNLDESPVIERDIRMMMNAIAHRGPDGEGLYVDGDVGLGHRRLAILDLSEAGKQPMSYGGGRYWIVYNGEVYNFVELRHELEAKGYTFQSNTDTEIILAAYDCWGPDCLERFNGMWAFALWDRGKQELFLARDRFGVKPLFYFANGRRLAFASEIKALWTLTDCPRQPNRIIVLNCLQGFPIDFSKDTIYEEIERLPSGHWMRVSQGNVLLRQWWDTRDHLCEVPSTPNEQTQHFAELFEDAARIRLRSDVPVGTLLSGGLDSSSIACTIARLKTDSRRLSGADRLSPDWQRTFTAEYPGSIMNEGEYARAVLEAYGLRGIFIHPQPTDLLESIQNVTRILDTPAVSSMPAVFAVYKVVHKNGIKVTLDGQGSDELLSGYGVSDCIYYYLKRGQLRQAWAAAECQAAHTRPPTSVLSVWKSTLWSSLRGIFPVRTTLYHLLRRERPIAPDRRGILSQAMLELPHPPEPESLSPERDSISARLYREFHVTILPQILRHYDHMAMSCSVESRMPFLDWRLVTYVFSLPTEQKVRDGYSKVILRQAMEGIVPEKVLHRRFKFGFPIAVEWFNTKRIQESIRSIISDVTFRQLDYWDARQLRVWFDLQCEVGWQYGEMEWIFRVLSTYFWYINHF